MLKFIKSVGMAALVVTAITAPAFSQTVDASGVMAACAQPDSMLDGCMVSVDEFITGLAELSDDQSDVALGDLASDLASVALAGGANVEVIVAALRAIAAAITDPVQATQILSIAQALEAGTDIPVFAIGDDGGEVVSSSPN
ncbi:hypothetical protein [Pelagibacterium sp.]|uniref:hypothetical protein n=1 Tax=Pelagibacterium sp. TaxID=1967288 RepID=UPI003BABB0C2